MKNHFTIPRIAGVLIAIFFMVTSCKKGEHDSPRETHVISIIDETSWNALQMELTTEDVLRLGHIEDEESPNSMTFTAYTLNDVALNRTFSSSLGGNSEFMTNTFTRQEEIDAFSEEVSGIFDQVYTIQPETFEYTQLWIPIAKILDSHYETHIDAHKVVIIQSDFLENSNEINFYQIRSSLEKDPERIRNYLDDLYPLEDLYGYEIVFLYQADRTNDRMFTAAANVFAGLMREKGATVSIKASL